MKKEDALKAIINSTGLDNMFNTAYKVLEHSPPLSQDKMLMIYAYYKQARHGNYVENINESDVSNYIQTFKNNAWIQIKGLNIDEAKQKYIDFTLKVIEEYYKD